MTVTISNSVAVTAFTLAFVEVLQDGTEQVAAVESIVPDVGAAQVRERGEGGGAASIRRGAALSMTRRLD